MTCNSVAQKWIKQTQPRETVREGREIDRIRRRDSSTDDRTIARSDGLS